MLSSIDGFQKLMDFFVKFSACFLLMLSFTGCVTTSGPASLGNVAYQDASAIETMDTKFGHTDLQMISEKITESLLQHPIFANANYKDPVIVALSHIVNNTNDRSFDTKYLSVNNVYFSRDLCYAWSNCEPIAWRRYVKDPVVGSVRFFLGKG